MYQPPKIKYLVIFRSQVAIKNMQHDFPTGKIIGVGNCVANIA